METTYYTRTRSLRSLWNDLYELPPARRRAVLAALAVSCLLFLAGFAAMIYFWHVARQFPRTPFRQPSRLYGQASRLTPGDPLSAAALVTQLKGQGYRQTRTDDAPLKRGTYRRDGDTVVVHLRRFPTADGMAGGVPVTVRFGKGRISRLEVAGRPAANAVLEPPLLASFYGPDLEERRPVALDEVPEHVIKAVLAAEDDAFFVHPGVSVPGIARALWVNLRGGELQQGGSTITQQLVKNVYLSSERTIRRKAKEAVIAMMLEVRYGKRAILEAYLNEIYWGHSGPANLIGLGAGSWAYFGKDPAELNLSEAAALAGMIRAPGDYSPLKHPRECIDRRDWVLQRMAELGTISKEEAEQAQREPLLVDPRTVDTRPLAPYFARFAQAEARERFDVDDLPDEGYVLFSTIGWREQKAAEAAVARGLAALENGWERRRRKEEDPLQAALVSIDPRDGSILAWVGGRDFKVSQFDRVAQARRQVGSAFKPVIYAAAFSEAVASPATLLRDSPIIVKVSGREWKPQNYDRGFHGWVTARSALEQSLNIPTVRLALQVGLHRVIEVAHDLGIEGNIDPVPALALGSFEASPLEMAKVYGTLANGGAQPRIHGLALVLDRSGETILGDDLGAPRRVLPPQAAYLVTSILQGAVAHGTGAGAAQWGLRDPLAGKTGTTNDRRDSWFAGYAPERVTVVWVGYDDNTKTRLSGARAALPIWSRFMGSVRPARGYLPFAPPPGMTEVTLDPTTGQLATPYCPYKTTELLPDWQVPTEPCHQHQPSSGETWALNNVPIDPTTGQPLTGYYGSESGYGYGEEGLAALPYGYGGENPESEPLTDFEPVELPPDALEPVDSPPGQIFPARPVDIPAEEGEDPEADGTILIRPSNPTPPETLPPTETPPPASAPVVVPPEAAPEDTPAADEETPPPPEETPPPPR